MMFNVPQFIDVEDKVAGPLTVKQLFWMIGMFATVLAVAAIFPGTVTFVVAVPIVVLFVLLAFYRPAGQPLISYVVHAFFFMLRPKVLMWRRPSSVPEHQTMKAKSGIEPVHLKTVSAEDIRRVAKLMDTR